MARRRHVAFDREALVTTIAARSAVAGIPRVILRLEGGALSAVATLLFARTGQSWWLYAGLFLVPDLSLAGYLAGPRIGAAIYNTAHATLGPAIVGGAGLALAQPTAVAVALIWAAHIGVDRLLGYGLKYGAGFGFTHLGRIGRDTMAGRG